MAGRAARTPFLLGKHQKLSRPQIRTGTRCVTGAMPRYAAALRWIRTSNPRMKSSGKTRGWYGLPEKQL
jgi:hypothetical protein